MHEIITGIQVIKMYTWEKSFAKLIKQAREYDMLYQVISHIIICKRCIL